MIPALKNFPWMKEKAARTLNPNPAKVTTCGWTFKFIKTFAKGSIAVRNPLTKYLFKSLISAIRQIIKIHNIISI